MTNITNVFVVDDDFAVRDSLRMMLKVAGYSVSTFSGADEFLSIFNEETKGCIILDVNMPGMNGPALQEELNRRGSRLPIIYLTGQGTIPLSVRSMKAGAMDFLTKPVDGNELLACVKQALQIFALIQEQQLESQTIVSRLEKLSEREKEVLLLVVQGLTSKEIAVHLDISFRTVENYRAHIMQKTNTKNIIDLAQFAALMHR